MKKIFITVLLSAVQFSANVGFANCSEKSLIAYLKVKPDTQDIFLNASENVIKMSRLEKGNIIYKLQQSVSDPQLFVFYELFKTHDDLVFHKNSKHVVDFLAHVKPILVPDGFQLTEFDACKDGVK